MIDLRWVVILFVCFFLNSCGRVVYFESDDAKYCIPSNYVISSSLFGEGNRENKPLGLVSVTFESDADYQKYLKPKSWLPGESLTALLVSDGLYQYQGLSNEFKISEGRFDEINIDGVVRFFERGNAPGWFILLNQRDDASESKYAKCFSMGGMKGQDLSRVSLDIPTSCYIEKVSNHRVLMKILRDPHKFTTHTISSLPI